MLFCRQEICVKNVQSNATMYELSYQNWLHRVRMVGNEFIDEDHFRHVVIKTSHLQNDFCNNQLKTKDWLNHKKLPEIYTVECP